VHRLAPLLLLAACTGTDDPSTVTDTGPRPGADLLDVNAFVLSAVDPLGHGTVDCPPAGWSIEGATVEVDTGACALAVLEQPLLADVRPSDTLEVVFWHNQLVAEEAAEGHLALLIDGAVIYERSVPIPQEPQAYTESFPGITAAPGALLQLHLHNHGANSWNLLHLERLPEDP
jgi:hypothetical protein